MRESLVTLVALHVLQCVFSADIVLAGSVSADSVWDPEPGLIVLGHANPIHDRPIFLENGATVEEAEAGTEAGKQADAEELAGFWEKAEATTLEQSMKRVLEDSVWNFEPGLIILGHANPIHDTFLLNDAIVEEAKAEAEAGMEGEEVEALWQKAEATTLDKSNDTVIKQYGDRINFEQFLEFYLMNFQMRRATDSADGVPRLAPAAESYLAQIPLESFPQNWTANPWAIHPAHLIPTIWAFVLRDVSLAKQRWQSNELDVMRARIESGNFANNSNQIDWFDAHCEVLFSHFDFYFDF